MDRPHLLTVDIDEYMSKMSEEDRHIYNLLSSTPESPDEVHVRRSLRATFIHCVSHARPYQYLAGSCIPDTKCGFQPPRWRYGYKFTYEQALAVNQENAPEDERTPPLSFFQEICDESVDVKKERSMVAGWWLKTRVQSMLEFRHEVGFKSVWDRGEKVQMFAFRDSWYSGDPLLGATVDEISELMFGKYVEPLWYLDAYHCFWYEKRK
ncbi:hypothetical protein HGRIS_009232 [Hohenbuehelia grisea]|uniref:Uncharacterized protein n=1 Tax=Hohenbuehelia grisea TaxID=104357 RepID=A0ABR3J0Y2_9AGAR